MKKALDLARKGKGFTNPNPMVGAVIVKNNEIIGEGYHEAIGGPHGEINALNNARASVIGGTLYVTLEPCSHYGKTPPCAPEIVRRGIKKVVVAMLDPNPMVSGNGIKHLRDHGVEVIVGTLEDEARKLNEIFIKYILTKLPFCILKSAMTLDGKIATESGDSKWVTSAQSRAHVHELRHSLMAIMVGVNTVIMDNPSLTTRLSGQVGRNPIRIIIDSSGRIPLEAKVLLKDGKTQPIIATTDQMDQSKEDELVRMGVCVLRTPQKNRRVDLENLMIQLGERGIDSVLIEGGSELSYSCLMEGVVDKVMTYIAPKILGGKNAKTPVGGIGLSKMSDAMPLYGIKVTSLDEDILVEGYINKEVEKCLPD
jgi:diaminohydroxyphosphoribosylaminopyrimidine deaminase/5-amino-6-(5-phosphoribosylamino)uracil reductase